jgi:glycosyltransferase involved in cell wall biosynthesis
MRAGAPVASSNGGALPEVLGDAAKFFDPGKIEEMADAIMKTIEDDAMRQTLIIKGKERISRYGWRETGRKTLEVYREALRTK